MTGQDVVARMRAAGLIDEIGGVTKVKTLGPPYPPGKMDWWPIEDCDMGHRIDAVKWWNDEGKYYGAKSDPVREWMLDPENYELQHKSVNRSEGAKLAHTDNYEPPEN